MSLHVAAAEGKLQNESSEQNTTLWKSTSQLPLVTSRRARSLPISSIFFLRSYFKGPPVHWAERSTVLGKPVRFLKGWVLLTHTCVVFYLVNTNWLFFPSPSLVTSCQHLLFSTERPHHRKLAQRTEDSYEDCSGLRPSASGTGATLQSRKKPTSSPSTPPLQSVVLQK